jgi:hypothetical protein
MDTKGSFVSLLKLKMDEFVFCSKLLSEGRLFGRSEDEIPGRRSIEIRKLHLSIQIRYNKTLKKEKLMLILLRGKYSPCYESLFGPFLREAEINVLYNTYHVHSN